MTFPRPLWPPRLQFTLHPPATPSASLWDLTPSARDAQSPCHLPGVTDRRCPRAGSHCPVSALDAIPRPRPGGEGGLQTPAGCPSFPPRPETWATRGPCLTAQLHTMTGESGSPARRRPGRSRAAQSLRVAPGHLPPLRSSDDRLTPLTNLIEQATPEKTPERELENDEPISTTYTGKKVFFCFLEQRGRCATSGVGALPLSSTSPGTSGGVRPRHTPSGAGKCNKAGTGEKPGPGSVGTGEPPGAAGQHVHRPQNSHSSFTHNCPQMPDYPSSLESWSNGGMLHVAINSNSTGSLTCNAEQKERDTKMRALIAFV